MSFTPLKLDAISLATIATPGTPVTVLGSIDRAGIENNSQFVTESPAGHPAPTMVALASIAPRITFQTKGIDTLVNAVTTWGIQCSARAWRKHSTGAAPASRAGTTNSYLSMAAGVAFWNQITLPQPRAGQAGTADATLLAAYNGVAQPIVNNASQALLSTALAGINFFAAGPVYINTALVPGVQSISIANQVAYRGEGDADNIADTYVEGTVQRVVVTIQTLSQYNWATLVTNGLAITDLTFFARKWQDGGLISFVADVTAEHILFNATNCVAGVVSSESAGQGLYLDTFQLVIAADDDTVPPLTTTINQAIAAP